jgi:GTPase
MSTPAEPVAAVSQRADRVRLTAHGGAKSGAAGGRQAGAVTRAQGDDALAPDAHRAGYVGLVGRPNVGKSTLLNRLVGQKVSITSPRPQTTRHRIIGIVSRPDAQFALVDTPGLQSRNPGRLNRALNRAAAETLESVDVIVFVVEALRFGAEDRAAVARVPPGRPVVLAINKVDVIPDKTALLPFIERLSHAHPFAAVVPISARTGRQVPELLEAIRPHLPEGPALFPEDDLTDRSERFLAAEFLREKLFRLLGAELPYATAVEIESFEAAPKLRRIGASIIVDRPGQKAIVIGRAGEKLKQIASQAREEMEKLFGSKVYLEVWVRVRHGWAEDARMLRNLEIE